MKKNFEYIEIEEGKSQYEEYDLTENKTVDAIYVRAKLEIDQAINTLKHCRFQDDMRIIIGNIKEY